MALVLALLTDDPGRVDTDRSNLDLGDIAYHDIRFGAQGQLGACQQGELSLGADIKLWERSRGTPVSIGLRMGPWRRRGG